VSIIVCHYLHDFLGLSALVTGARDWGSARKAHIQSSGQKGISHHCGSCRSSNAPNISISLGLMFASSSSKQRLFLSPSFLDLVQVLKGVVAQMAIGQSSLICVFHLLANHGNDYQSPVV